jgi:hypothetical protein
MKLKLQYYPEPKLTFGFNQKTTDPRDGLILFGPHEPLSPFKVKAGIVATEEGLTAYKEFVEKINKPIFSTKTIYGTLKNDEVARPSFPGFEAVFGIKWSPIPEIYKPLTQSFIDGFLQEKQKKKRTQSLVDLYLERIVHATNNEDAQVNIWFIVIPRNLYFRCKPGSAGKDLSSGTKKFLVSSQKGQSSLLFPGEENYVEELQRLVDTSSDFHHLLKARLIQEKITTPVQIILESTLRFRDKYRNLPLDENMKAHLAWTQTTTMFYKFGNLPWKLADIRDGVCYLGLVFKKTNQILESSTVCSAAQMFLKDGDGSVFRGNIGLWQGKNEKEFHLDEPSSYDLLSMALDDYKDKWNKFPLELFIHGRAIFSDEEWNGFQRAVIERKAETNLVGIVIKDTGGFKLFRDVENEPSNYGVMRGMALKINDNEAYLITRGFIPRLNTASSLEIPNPLHIKITRGSADIDTVLKDVLALTKLNYNACIHGDGLPVTLRFSDTIGSILTATNNFKTDQRKFMYYI